MTSVARLNVTQTRADGMHVAARHAPRTDTHTKKKDDGGRGNAAGEKEERADWKTGMGGGWVGAGESSTLY